MNPGAEKKKSYGTFWNLNFLMFQGALSDNVLKLILMLLVRDLAHLEFPDQVEKATSLAGTYQMIVSGLFILPFILMATVSGWIGDRFSKTTVTRFIKVLEVGVMLLAMISLGYGYYWWAVGVLFLMGCQSALFSPSKYGILPELFPESKIAWANGVLQGITFLAIIVGTFLGPWLYGTFKDAMWVPGFLLVILAIIGFYFGMRMHKPPPAAPEEEFRVNPMILLRRYGGEILRHRGIKWSCLGMIVWWLVGIMLQNAAVLAATDILGLSETQTGVALLPIVVGIGLGCFATSLISKDRIELGLTPIGAILMFVTCAYVWYITPDHVALRRLTGDEVSSLRITLPLAMGMVGFVTGFFIVPLQSYVVQRTNPKLRGGVWAVLNIMTALGMVVGTVLYGGIVAVTASPGAVFFAGGLIMLATGGMIAVKFPPLIREIPGLFLRPFGFSSSSQSQGTDKS